MKFRGSVDHSVSWNVFRIVSLGLDDAELAHVSIFLFPVSSFFYSRTFFSSLHSSYRVKLLTDAHRSFARIPLRRPRAGQRVLLRDRENKNGER